MIMYGRTTPTQQKIGAKTVENASVRPRTGRGRAQSDVSDTVRMRETVEKTCNEVYDVL